MRCREGTLAIGFLKHNLVTAIEASIQEEDTFYRF